ELGRMQDVALALAEVDVVPDIPAGIELVPAAEEYDEGAWRVAFEADADIPSGEPIRTGDLEQWRARHLDGLAVRELSFVALENGRVVGYALLMRHTPGTLQHSMTGVARAVRGRGVGLALKQAQIAAAKAAGIEQLRAQNDLANAPMRRINE